MFSLFLLLDRRRPEEAQRWLQKAADTGYGPAIDRLNGSTVSSAGNPGEFKKGMGELKEGLETFKGFIDMFKKKP